MTDILFPFQRELVEQSKPNYLYACDVGTGKTLISIHHYLKYQQGEPLLIVAPPAKLKEGGWDREIAFVEDTYNLTIDYETLSYGVLAKRWKEYADYFVIFDEVHYIKNSTSQRGKAGQKLTKFATNFCLLSGSPASNGFEDMINYFIIFGFTKNKTQFNKEFGIWTQKFFGQRVVNVVDDYKEKDKLLGWYRSFSVTVKKDDVLDLPPILFQQIRFKPSKEYKQIEKHRVLDDEIFDNPSSLAHGLRKYANLNDKKDYTKMLFESTEENIVIFYQYTSELETLKSIAKDKTIYEVNGNKQNIPTKSEWENITNSVTLVQYQAGSAGIELQYANILIYYTPTFSYQDYVQSLGRIHRNGQKRKVTVYKYITVGSMEENVWMSLNDKKDFDTQLYVATKLKERK